MKWLKQFGGKLTKERIAKYEKSPNWRDGVFQNLEETTMDISVGKIPGLLCEQIFNKKGKEPEQPLPLVPFDKAAFLAADEEVKIIWYGHSVVLLRIHDKTILIDPMMGSNASPIAPFPTKRFSKDTLAVLDDFPDIDILLMSHDHYDHIDLDSFQRLKSKVKRYVVSLGTGRHYEDWGIDNKLITELDWWESISVGDLDIYLTPSRHFSGRGATNRAKSFWGGWVLRSPKHNIWFSGDGGYGTHFNEIGKRLGPFDFAFMECGQYNKLWHKIHMYPEESVQAALDAGAEKIMPLHWAGFALALHHWKDPIQRFTEAAEEKRIPYVTPRLGELFTLDANPKARWWEDYD